MKEYPFKKMPGMDNIEVEHGETIQLPDGNVYQVNGKTHKRGGENVYAPDNSRVFSQHLKLPSSVSKELGGPERRISPAELSKRYPTEKFRTMLEKSKNDPIKEKTAALMHAKHLTMQDAIFTAQESMKEEKKINKKSFRYGGLKKYQQGDQVWDPLKSTLTTMPLGMLGRSDIVGASELMFSPDQLGQMATSPGAKLDVPGVGRVRVTNLANQSATGFQAPDYWSQVYGKQTGYMPGNQALGDWQRRITNLDFGNPEEAPQVRAEYANFLQEANQRNPDQNLTHFVMQDGKRVPIDQYDITRPVGGVPSINRRTGQETRVDYREGNLGEPTSNQRFFPVRVQVEPDALTPLPNINRARPMPPAPQPVKPEPPKTYDDEPYTFKEEIAQIDPEQYYNALMGGLDLATLASIRRENPYYAINTANPSTTRFDPINTMQNERAFNMARNAVLNSNLPDSVKQSQLAQLQANMAEGVNQVDITNYQGNLANQNANIQRVDAARDFNAQNRNAANLNYLQSLGAARNMVDRQRQELIDRMTDRWRSRLQNQMNIQLINQMVPNYEFNPNGGVQYKPGSTPVDYNTLDPFEILRAAALASQQKTS